jgi:hypothetical protein
VLGGIDVNALRNMPRCYMIRRFRCWHQWREHLPNQKSAGLPNMRARSHMQRCCDISTAERCSAAGRQRRALEFGASARDLRLHCVESSGGFAKLDLLRLKSFIVSGTRAQNRGRSAGICAKCLRVLEFAERRP